MKGVKMAKNDEKDPTKVSNEEFLKRAEDFDTELKKNLNSISFLEKIEKEARKVSTVDTEEALRVINI
jgi:hypothetical protein